MLFYLTVPPDYLGVPASEKAETNYYTVLMNIRRNYELCSRG